MEGYGILGWDLWGEEGIVGGNGEGLEGSLGFLGGGIGNLGGNREFSPKFGVLPESGWRKSGWFW